MLGVLECANGQWCSLSSKEHENLLFRVTETPREETAFLVSKFLNAWFFHFFIS